MFKWTAILLTGLLTTAAARSESMTSVKPAVIVPLAGMQLQVQPVTPAIFRITVAPAGRFSNRNSLAVIKAPEAFEWSQKTAGETIMLQTTAARVLIDRKTGRITFTDSDGRIRLESMAPGQEALRPAGAVPAAAANAANLYQISQTFLFPPAEGLYGLGQFEDGVLDMRGQDVLLTQANRVAVNPTLVSSSGTAILWDQASLSRFRNHDQQTIFWSEAAEQIDYYVILGRGADEAIAGYRTLTGAAPLFPLWAYGYFQSKERYRSAAELVEVVQEYRRRQIPLDVIVQDWSYWGGQEYFSGMRWDPAFYPDPRGMTAALHALHARLMISIWPAFGPESAIYQEMAKKGLLFPEPHWSGSRVYDAGSPEARAIYWRHVKEALFDQGVDAWWMDGTEPEFRCTDDRYVTAGAIKSAGATALGDPRLTLNAYSLLTTRGVYEGQRAAAPEKRVFILTRSAFSGQQRHAAVTWSGDTAAGWESFRQQITAGLTFSLSGLPYWTADIGGFFTGPIFPTGVDDPAFRELYLRWFQFGAFCPVFRSHGTQTPREVWRFGEPGEAVYDALVEASRLRYRLLPYIYSLAWRVTDEGYTMMRGLPMDFPADPAAANNGRQFMFGPALMVCPVTRPLEHPPADPAEPVPGRCLFGPDGEPGLHMTFYGDTDFKGAVQARKLDQSGLGWFGCLPNSLQGAYSVRLEGALRAEASGEHTILVRSNGSVRLWIDDTLLIDAPANREEQGFSARVGLQAGKNHLLRLEHQQWQPQQASLRLAWIKPGEPRQSREQAVYLPTLHGVTGPESARDSSSQSPAGAQPAPRANSAGDKDHSQPAGLRSALSPPASPPADGKGGNPGAAGVWYDFYSGAVVPAGERTVPVVLAHQPLFVPAGSILPLGPDLQYSGEKAADPLEIRLYAGRDADFTLYEDEGESYRYEAGQYALIPLHWDERRQQLTIGQRRGAFPGMLAEREFRIVLVRPDHGAGAAPCSSPDRTVRYSGDEVILDLAAAPR